jgi:hypothetical protein
MRLICISGSMTMVWPSTQPPVRNSCRNGDGSSSARVRSLSGEPPVLDSPPVRVVWGDKAMLSYVPA